MVFSIKMSCFSFLLSFQSLNCELLSYFKKPEDVRFRHDFTIFSLFWGACKFAKNLRWFMPSCTQTADFLVFFCLTWDCLQIHDCATISQGKCEGIFYLAVSGGSVFTFTISAVYSKKRLFRCEIFSEPFVGFNDKFEVDVSHFVQLLGLLFVFAPYVGFCQLLVRFLGWN